MNQATPETLADKRKKYLAGRKKRHNESLEWRRRHNEFDHCLKCDRKLDAEPFEEEMCTWYPPPTSVSGYINSEDYIHRILTGGCLWCFTSQSELQEWLVFNRIDLNPSIPEHLKDKPELDDLKNRLIYFHESRKHKPLSQNAGADWDYWRDITLGIKSEHDRFGKDGILKSHLWGVNEYRRIYHYLKPEGWGGHANS